MTQRCHPSQGFFGQPYLHMSPNSGDWPPLDPTSQSVASRCKPICAHALSVSAETQGHGNTSFDTTTCSFFMRKKESSPCGPCFPGTFQCVEAARKRTLSFGSKQGQTPSQKGRSHIFYKILAPAMLQAIAVTKTGNDTL